MTTYLCNDCGEHLDSEASALNHESHHHDGAQTCWPTVTFETNFGFAGELVSALKEATASHQSSLSVPPWVATLDAVRHSLVNSMREGTRSEQECPV